ncbi:MULTISPECIES: DUF445 domain-containing protein [Bacillus]|uniref:DUF445 domain-containing protein n=1 Tax=Bacillus TaxID=1386 RepID=UPI000BB9B256|nr:MULTISPECIES: DUF445 family protein [Bacillus]
MNTFLLFLMMISIGAFIGGLTNSLAIRMLFRPYNPIYIGKRRLPFTPGLIPKRRDELAIQLGKLVMEHLLTAESMKRRLIQKGFQQEILQWMMKQTETFLSSEKTVKETFQSFGVENPKQMLQENANDWLQKKYETALKEFGDLPIESIIPEELLNKMEEHIPQVSEYILQKGTDYFESEQGKAQLSKMIQDFIQTRGMLGNMVQMFLGNYSLADKVQPEVIKFLKHDGTKDVLQKVLLTEWNKVKALTVAEVEAKLSKQALVNSGIQLLEKMVDLDKQLNKSISEVTQPIKQPLLHNVLPTVVDSGTTILLNQLENLLSKLQLEQIVKEQVESFSLPKLEQIVLSVSSRELKMITYLGALLGGMIGFVQGLMVFML